jgi:hypothetical protein
MSKATTPEHRVAEICQLEMLLGIMMLVPVTMQDARYIQRLRTRLTRLVSNQEAAP